MTHPDQFKGADKLPGYTLTRADAEILDDLDRGTRWARALFTALRADQRVWPVLESLPSGPNTSVADEIELYLEDEGLQSELCWLWDKPDEG